MSQSSQSLPPRRGPRPEFPTTGPTSDPTHRYECYILHYSLDFQESIYNFRVKALAKATLARWTAKYPSGSGFIERVKVEKAIGIRDWEYADILEPVGQPQTKPKPSLTRQSKGLAASRSTRGLGDSCQ